MACSLLLVISVPKMFLNGQFYFNLSSKTWSHDFFGTQCSLTLRKGVLNTLIFTVAYSCQHPPPTPTIPAPEYAHANPLCGSGCVADAQRQRIERNYSPPDKVNRSTVWGSCVVTYHNTYAYKRPKSGSCRVVHSTSLQHTNRKELSTVP